MTQRIFRCVGMRILLILLCLVSVQPAHAQHFSLSRLTLTSSTDGVFIEWTIARGNTCNGTTIERRLPGEEFAAIGRIEGICGSETEPVDYEFLDAAPVINVLAEYRLVLGNLGPSEPLPLRYLDPANGPFTLLGLPADGQIQLLPTIQMSGTQEVVIYDAMGRSREQMTIASQGLIIDLLAFPSGQYFIAVMDEGQVLYTTRFMHLAN